MYEKEIIKLLLEGDLNIVRYIVNRISGDEIEVDLFRRVYEIVSSILQKDEIKNVELILKHFENEEEHKC